MNIEKDIWHWYHNVSECHYHIQLTIKYRKSLFIKETEKIISETMEGFKDGYAIKINNVGFNKNYAHLFVIAIFT